jgi:hypothetical protein
MVNRTTVSGASTPPLAPVDYFNEYAERLDTLFDASALPLTSIGGTGDAVTATLDPALASAGVFVDGMKFTLTWGAANTAGVTLAINGGAALPVLDAAGDALATGSLDSGLRSLIEYVGGSFHILSPIRDGASQSRFYWAFTSSGTWNKPSGLDDDTMVLIEGWGSGGGGGTSSGGGGGGGGGYKRLWMRLADIPSSVPVTIAAGGAVATSGAATTFGTLLTAYGGGRGSSSSDGGGGGGGGLGGSGAGNTGSGSALGGAVGGGNGGASGAVGSDAALESGGGGGGGGVNSGSGRQGGSAAYGGGGGAGQGSSGSPPGGVSIYGGAGGDPNVAGLAPGGGGGRNAAGARGELRVWI